MEDIYAVMATQIINQQAKIIGPIAYRQAEKVPGLVIDKSTHLASIQGEGNQALDALVAQYRLFFGDIAVEVSKEAVSSLRSSLDPSKVPASLR